MIAGCIRDCGLKATGRKAAGQLWLQSQRPLILNFRAPINND